MTNDTFKKIGKSLDDFSKAHSIELETLTKHSEKMIKACQDIEQSWSGSFVGWHGKMYFQDFKKPAMHERFSSEWGGLNGLSEGWEEKNAVQIEAKIGQIVGGNFSAKSFDEKSTTLRKSLVELKEEINVDLTSLDLTGLPTSKEMYKKIVGFSWEQPRVDFVNTMLPKNFMTRDTEAASQGMVIPGWLYLESVAHEGGKTIELFDSYKKLIKRLEKQIGIEESSTNNKANPTQANFYGIHKTVIAKCGSLYETGAYAEAVEKGFKVVKDKLRELTGYENGSDAFGKGNLHVKGAVALNVDSDFNKACQFLTMAIDMFRNEKSHTSDAKIDDLVRAYQYLAMSSLALSLLENSEIKL